MTTTKETRQAKRIGKYVLGKTLAYGSHGSVKSAVNVETGEKYAIKVCQKNSNSRTIAHVNAEVTALRRLQHALIVRLEEVLVSRNNIYTVMSFAPGGDMQQYIASRGRLSEESSRTYFQQLLTAVDFCHSRGVVHRDLKPENILIGNNSIQLCDFGYAKCNQSEETFDPRDTLSTPCGTLGYVAPEVIKSHQTKIPYDPVAAEAWSCGVILYTMLAGALPQTAPQSWQEGVRRLQSRRMGKIVFPSYFSDSAVDLLSRVLVEDPRERMSVKEIQAHPFVSSSKNRRGSLVRLEPLSSNSSSELSISENSVVSEFTTNSTTSSRNSVSVSQADLRTLRKMKQSDSFKHLTTYSNNPDSPASLGFGKLPLFQSRA